ncbi:unnamed protein product [Diamesa hyperborea]
MPQQFKSAIRTYKYPFELVMAAYERRFPTCPQMPIVLDCVVSEDTTDGPKRQTKRRCKLRVDAPYIFKKLIGLDVAYFIQENFLDLKERKLTIEATNETFSSRIKIFERCRYYVHPENSSWTCFDQTAEIEITNFFGFEHSMEKVGMKQYTQLTLKGKEIIEFFIDELEKEGITEVAIWKDPVGSPEVEKKDSDCDLIDSDHRLDADYIKNYLGSLTPLQESKLIQMRKKLEEKDIKEIPDYPTLLRFLRARDFSIEKSTNMLIESLKWREEHDVDNLLKTYREPQVVEKYFPGEWSQITDNEQRPMYIIKLGHMDVKGLLKSIGEDGLLRLTLYICEQGLKMMEELTKRHGKPIWSWCLLVDCQNLCMRHLWRPGVKALLRIIETVEKNYPETMGRVLICRAPRVFPVLWTIVSAFIDENTRNKFLFFDNTPKNGLEHYIPSMPSDFLTSSDVALIHNGGVVPKQLYKSDSLDESDGAVIARETSGDDVTATKIQLNSTNLYQTINLQAGQIYEVVIKNDDHKAVLTWDYESLRDEILFTIYETEQSITVSNEDNYTSIFDTCNMKENVNYKKKEQPVMSRPKESLQGSMEMEKSTYILQWTMPPCSEQQSTQLIYFYEILSSANYRGSMTSLQSGLSAMSLHSR